MSNQPNVTPNYEASRERFAAELAKASAPNARPAAVQREPNKELAQAAKELQAAVNPDGSHKATPSEIQAAWQRAFETPTSAGTVGSSDPRVHPGTGFVAKSGHHFQRVTSGAGQPLVVQVPDGHRYEVYQTENGPRSRFVPDASAYVGPVTKTAEADQFGRQTAMLAPEGVDVARFNAQKAELDALAATRVNGERLYDKPTERARLEAVRAKLYAGEDVSSWLAQAKSVVAEANFTTEVKAEGFAIRAPEGYELSASEVRKFASIAKKNGVSQEAFQAMVDAYVKENS